MMTCAGSAVLNIMVTRAGQAVLNIMLISTYKDIFIKHRNKMISGCNASLCARKLSVEPHIKFPLHFSPVVYGLGKVFQNSTQGTVSRPLNIKYNLKVNSDKFAFYAKF